MGRLSTFLRRQWKWIACGGLAFLLLGFSGMNLLAYRHAYAMTHYLRPGDTPFQEMTGFQKFCILFNGAPMPKPMITVLPTAVQLRYETLHVRVDGGIDLEAWYVPNARASSFVLLFHGRGMTKSSMLEQARALHDAGMAVFMPDFRGGGGSNQYYDSIGYYEADDVAACVAYVQKNLAAGKPIFLYGQSMGAAAVARAVAVYQLDVGGIVLQSVFDTLENAVTRQFARVGLPKFPAVPLMLFWGGRATNMPAQAHNPVDYAASIHCPALVLHGTADVEAPLAEGRRVFNALPGDRSIYLFKGLGHVSLIHEDPVNWKREVIGFVRAHGG